MTLQAALNIVYGQRLHLDHKHLHEIPLASSSILLPFASLKSPVQAMDAVCGLFQVAATRVVRRQ